MRARRLYIASRGSDAAVLEAARRLDHAGYKTAVPTGTLGPAGRRNDLRRLLDSHGMVLGERDDAEPTEVDVAEYVGMPIASLDEWLAGERRD